MILRKSMNSSSPGRVASFITKFGRPVVRFGDDLNVDQANFLCVGGHEQFTGTKFTRPTPKISKFSYYSAQCMDGPFPSLPKLAARGTSEIHSR